MPSITTHYIFANDVFDRLNKKEKEHLKNEMVLYNNFAQSHDYLYHYFGSIKNGKKIRKLGFIGHHQKTQDYLLNIVKEIIDKDLKNNGEAIAYLYGSITHYVLDVNCHPFIFYKTGVYRKNEKWTRKYNGEHSHIEKDIDAIFYERKYHKKYNHCKLNRDIIKNPIFTEGLKELITNVYKKTYDYDDLGNIYYKSIKCNKFINTFVTNDYLGIKRAIYLLIDKIFGYRTGCLASYSNHIMHPKIEWLNLEHKEWNHPCYKDVKYNTSFDDLYNKSITDCLNIIRGVNKVIYEKENINTLKELIPDTDYANGLDCSNPLYMNYFEY